MTELTQDEIDQVHGGFLSKFGKFLGFVALAYTSSFLGLTKVFIPR